VRAAEIRALQRSQSWSRIIKHQRSRRLSNRDIAFPDILPVHSSSPLADELIASEVKRKTEPPPTLEWHLIDGKARFARAPRSQSMVEIDSTKMPSPFTHSVAAATTPVSLTIGDEAQAIRQDALETLQPVALSSLFEAHHQRLSLASTVRLKCNQEIMDAMNAAEINVARIASRYGKDNSARRSCLDRAIAGASHPSTFFTIPYIEPCLHQDLDAFIDDSVSGSMLVMASGSTSSLLDLA
jgi:hypothetical protein